MGEGTGYPQQAEIREMMQEDIDAVLEIDRKIAGSDRAMTYDTPPSSYVGGQLDVSVVAEVGGQVVGFLLGWVTAPPHGVGDTAWVQSIGVDPEQRRQGIASRLLEAFAQRCRDKGAQSVHMMVSWHDWWMLSFLTSQGFSRGEMAEFIKPLL